VPEPKRADAAMNALAPIYTLRGLVDAIVGPFIAFFKTYGWLALLMLVAISFYRVPDFIMGPMVNPYYHDIGLTKDTVAAVRASVSFIASLGGIAAGGFVALRFGYMRALILGGILQAAAIAAFAILATSKADLPTFVAIMAFDSIATTFAGVALVSYMSSLTSLGYTATQYALLSSSYIFLGKFLKGFSGAVVDWLSKGGDLMHAYAVFFIGCGLAGLPGVALFLVLARIHARREKAAAVPAV
jgi:PAT family beta-lactamase induction signal transducer AmpG